MPLERRRFDVLVVGGGPAGIAAALAAAEAGSRAGLVDENLAPGGQIWRGGAHGRGKSARARAALRRLAGSNVEVVHGARVFARPGRGTIRAETDGGLLDLEHDRLVLAPGARELFLPFPGWTLPGVTGVGGLQALAKGGWPVVGRRVVVAGSGPLLLAVAAHLKAAGADVRLVAEQAPARAVARFGLGLLGSPGKLAQAAALRLVALRGVPYRPGWWPVEACGEKSVESVRLTNGRATLVLPCDLLACGFGLVPNTELPRLLGCVTAGGKVVVDDYQRTSEADTHCAGEATGIGGVDLSWVEGEVAGYAAAGRPDRARERFAAPRQAQAFADALGRAFALRDELKTLARPETIVCRCEDVALGQIAPYADPRAAKLQTRCGIGPCQGRVCGPALRYLKGWAEECGRPPAVPVRLGSLAVGSSATPPL